MIRTVITKEHNREHNIMQYPTCIFYNIIVYNNTYFIKLYNIIIHIL